jgi:hypothetical protein
MGFAPLGALTVDPLLRKDLNGSPWIQIWIDLKIARFWIVVARPAPLGRSDLLPDLLGRHCLHSEIGRALNAGDLNDRCLAGSCKRDQGLKRWFGKFRIDLNSHNGPGKPLRGRPRAFGVDLVVVWLPQALSGSSLEYVPRSG